MRRILKSSDKGFLSVSMIGGLSVILVVMSTLVVAGEVQDQTTAALKIKLDEARTAYVEARDVIHRWQPLPVELE